MKTRKQTKLKTMFILGIILIIIALMLVSYASALRVVCLKKGDKLPSAENPRYICKHDTCQVCVNDNNYPSYNKNCPIKKDCVFNNNGRENNGTIGGLDVTPPVLTINSPIEGNVYNSKSVLFDLKSNEIATFYLDIGNKGTFSRLAANLLAYSKTVSIRDGENEVKIKAIDSNYNEVVLSRTFYVDSAKPKITKTDGGKKFANGEFKVWFTEQNPSSIVLDYGNYVIGRRTFNIPVSSCTNEGSKYYCSASVALDDYNSQNIDFTFKVSDIAGNYHESKAVALKVDSAEPIITNSPIYSINKKYVTFSLNIDEANLDSVSYYDNSLSRPLWKKLCTSLKNGMCIKKVTFTRGSHIVDVMALDKAGNSFTQRVSFDVNY